MRGQFGKPGERPLSYDDWECVRCGRTNIGPYAKTPLGKMSTGCFLMASKNREFESQETLEAYTDGGKNAK